MRNPPLYKIYLYLNLYFFENYSSDFADFADDTTPYECGHSCNEVINNLETTGEKVFELFSFNNLTL